MDAEKQALTDEIARLRDALSEQLLLQYGKEPDNLNNAIGRLVAMRKERMELDADLAEEPQP